MGMAKDTIAEWGMRQEAGHAAEGPHPNRRPEGTRPIAMGEGLADAQIEAIPGVPPPVSLRTGRRVGDEGRPARPRSVFGRNPEWECGAVRQNQRVFCTSRGPILADAEGTGQGSRFAAVSFPRQG